MTANARIWPLIVILVIFSAPLVIMYFYQVIDSIAQPDPGSPFKLALSLGADRFRTAIDLGCHLEHLPFCQHDGFLGHLVVDDGWVCAFAA